MISSQSLLLGSLLWLLCIQNVARAWAKSQLCEVETGQTNIILDIEESRGSFIGQQTMPPELPISGDPYKEIALDLVFPKGNAIFLLDGKKLKLLQPLDRDEENLSHIVFQVSCTTRPPGKKRNIPIIVRVSDVNDNAPRFMDTPYEVTVPESTPVGTTIFRNIQALDKDAGVNGLVEYFIVEGSTNSTEDEKMTIADGYSTFAISFPHQGQVTIAKTLDYEKIQRFYLTIVASPLQLRIMNWRREQQCYVITNPPDDLSLLATDQVFVLKQFDPDLEYKPPVVRAPSGGRSATRRAPVLAAPTMTITLGCSCVAP